MVAIATPIKRDPGKHITRGGAAEKHNVGDTERLLSIAGGGLLAVCGLRDGGPVGLGLAALGGALLYRGLSGHCPMYEALEMSTEKHSPVAAVAAGHGVKLEHAVTIQRPAADLFKHWRNFKNLPRIMSHLVSVEGDGKHTHWIAHAPAGMTVEWDAEIVNEEPNRLIAWRSLEGSQIATAGSVHFNELGHNRGTEVHVTLKYDPPAGKLGSWIAWLFGEEPGQQIREDLARFKQMMEAGANSMGQGRT